MIQLEIASHPPAFTNIGEALNDLDRIRDQEQARMEEEARLLMGLDQEDPTQQNYFIRVDRGTVVKTEAEYTRCQLAGVTLREVPYVQALQALKDEEARKRQAKKLDQKKKAARKARKRNR